ncbi:MAG: 2',3'-cyclic-nucleotide 2'-phosphodiesterase (5'-nucleotidase family) [Verrucomicrobiales bacterium]|jgi:2',3'-cyclic-nucleotide 2'-phosphodiesterase (5'-nucleotidase family)
MMMPTDNPARRHFLKLLGGTALASASRPWQAHAEQDVRTISIIHTTDLHGHILPSATYEGLSDVGGLARCATLIRQWRKQNPNSLLLDIGDVYQGTRTSQRNGGELMIKLFNKLNYDSWTLGNHEFDWGIEPLQNAVQNSNMPVLTSNVKLEGKLPGSLEDDGNPLSNIAPYMMKEIGGFKIGVIGVVTPGLPFWLRPEMTKGIEVFDPAEAVQSAARALKLRGANAIVVTGHMGHRFGHDDFANRVTDITEKCPDVNVFIGGHTHIDVPNYRAGKALYTQAGYHGIYLGRVDLAFSMENHRLVDKRSFTVMMDRRFDLDPIVIDTASSEIEAAKRDLAKPVGKLAATLSAKTKPGEPSDIQRLHAVSIRDVLAKNGVEIDAVLHGQFIKSDVEPGEKTLADMYLLAPYENLIVTAEVTREQLIVIAQETGTQKSARNIMGLKVIYDGETVTEITQQDGSPLDPEKRYTLAVNSYDSQSGGKRLLELRAVMQEKLTNATFHPQETRDALSEFFLDKGTVSASDLVFKS